MNKGVLVKFRDEQGNWRKGLYAGEELVTVSGHDIRQIPMASYGYWEIREKLVEYALQYPMSRKDSWEDKPTYPNCAELGTLGEVWNAMQSTSDDYGAIERRFKAWLVYEELEGHFKNILETALEPTDDDFEESFNDCGETLEYLLTELTKESPSIVVGITLNLTYRKVPAYKVVNLGSEKGVDILSGFLPDTSDISLEIYDNKEEGVRLRVAHHDVPTGSEINIKSLRGLLQELPREVLLDIAKEWLSYNDGYEKALYKELFNIELRGTGNDKCVSRHLSKYTKEKLINAVEWMIVETGEIEYAVDKYMEQYIAKACSERNNIKNNYK